MSVSSGQFPNGAKLSSWHPDVRVVNIFKRCPACTTMASESILKPCETFEEYKAFDDAVANNDLLVPPFNMAVNFKALSRRTRQRTDMWTCPSHVKEVARRSGTIDRWKSSHKDDADSLITHMLNSPTLPWPPASLTNGSSVVRSEDRQAVDRAQTEQFRRSTRGLLMSFDRPEELSAYDAFHQQVDASDVLDTRDKLIYTHDAYRYCRGRAQPTKFVNEPSKYKLCDPPVHPVVFSHPEFYEESQIVGYKESFMTLPNYQELSEAWNAEHPEDPRPSLVDAAAPLRTRNDDSGFSSEGGQSCGSEDEGSREMATTGFGSIGSVMSSPTNELGSIVDVISNLTLSRAATASGSQPQSHDWPSRPRGRRRSSVFGDKNPWHSYGMIDSEGSGE
ncbi:hypothetical protein I316_00757 [Kwoniella heveanensis BCC8398]|uniref:Uncharacterized protein n=1 Tax=Kwoniella heveanensis BCC8398 TaxID=1296120 RepID=A0A1B9H2Z3_9TREE|nr:hypothetical protein I316_00757 [Kwoniella heveanensis BCC8398]